MIKSVITYLNLKVDNLGYFNEVYCLAEKIEREGKTYPALYNTSNEYTLIRLDEKGSICYWRKNGDVSISEEENNSSGCAVQYKTTVPLKFVGFLRKDSPYNDQYFADNIISEIIGHVTTNNSALKKSLKAKSVSVTAAKYVTDANEVAKDEYDNVDFEPRYSHAYFSIDFNLVVVTNKNCFIELCNHEPFACPTLVELLEAGTAQEGVDAIEEAGKTDEISDLLCGSCDPVLIKDQDGNTIDTVAAGGEYDVIVLSGIDGGSSSTTYTNSIIDS